MLGSYLKMFRLRLKLNQKVMAEKLSISTSLLCRIEKDKCNITDELLERILIVFTDVLTAADYEQIRLYKLEKDNSKDSKNKISISNKILKVFRNSHNMTQLELAKKLGYSTSYISFLENDGSVMSEDFIKRLLTIFDDLMLKEEKETFLEYLAENVNNPDFNMCNKNIFFGNWLKDFRINNRLSRKEMSNCLNISEKLLCKLENGQTEVSYEIFSKFMLNYSNMITESEQEMLLSLVSKNLPKVVEKRISNFIINNKLEEILLNFSEIHLSKDEINYVFSKALKEAKTLKKKRG